MDPAVQLYLSSLPPDERSSMLAAYQEPLLRQEVAKKASEFARAYPPAVLEYASRQRGSGPDAPPVPLPSQRAAQSFRAGAIPGNTELEHFFSSMPPDDASSMRAALAEPATHWDVLSEAKRYTESPESRQPRVAGHLGNMLSPQDQAVLTSNPSTLGERDAGRYRELVGFMGEEAGVNAQPDPSQIRSQIDRLPPEAKQALLEELLRMRSQATAADHLGVRQASQPAPPSPQQPAPAWHPPMR